MIFDSSVKNVISSAFENKTDVFLRMNPPCSEELIFDDVKAAVFMPGGFLQKGNAPFYDIRRLADEDFRKGLLEDNIRRLIVLSAECADKSEYGYRESFGWIGEMRAEIHEYIQVVAFFSPASDSVELCRTLFGSDRPYCLGEREEPVFDCFCAESHKAKFIYTARLAEKNAFKRTAVYFNSREEAGSFGGFLERRGTRCVYVDGAQAPEELREGILKFTSGEINILIATKSFASTAYFYPPDKAVFCGVPFSLSHLSRCGGILSSEKLFVVYCGEDIKRNEKIIASFSERLSDGEISQLRKCRLRDMVKMLNIKE